MEDEAAAEAAEAAVAAEAAAEVEAAVVVPVPVATLVSTAMDLVVLMLVAQALLTPTTSVLKQMRIQ